MSCVRIVPLFGGTANRRPAPGSTSIKTVQDGGQDRRLRRVARLRDEVLDETGLDLDGTALFELDYALRPPVHEGRTPSYGAVVARPSADGQQVLSLGRETGAVLVQPHEIERNTMRMLADGYSAFVWADEDDALVVLHPFAPDAVSVARFAAETGTVVVRRSKAGVVTVTVAEAVATFDGHWRIRPSASAYVRPYRTLFEPSRPNERVLRSVLQLSLDVLSPAGVGATIVWTPSVDLSKESHFDERPAITLPALDIADARCGGTSDGGTQDQACASSGSTPPPAIPTANSGPHLRRSSTGPSERDAAQWSWSICLRIGRRIPETSSRPGWTSSARETTR